MLHQGKHEPDPSCGHAPRWRQAMARMAGSLGPSVAMACAGLVLLAGLVLTPGPRDRHLGLLFPPWIGRNDAVRLAARLHLPVTGIRLSGRLVLLVRDPGTDHQTIAEIAAATGAFVIDAGPAATCAFPSEPKAYSNDA